MLEADQFITQSHGPTLEALSIILSRTSSFSPYPNVDRTASLSVWTEPESPVDRKEAAGIIAGTKAYQGPKSLSRASPKDVMLST